MVQSTIPFCAIILVQEVFMKVNLEPLYMDFNKATGMVDNGRPIKKPLSPLIQRNIS